MATTEGTFDLERLNRPVPRYTSYPTAADWSDTFNDSSFLNVLSHLTREVSCYVHIPFCRNRCYYCGCNVVLARRNDVADRYIEHLKDEIDLKMSFSSGQSALKQLHFGGGTPTFLSIGSLEAILEHLSKHFSWAKDLELSIEIDPMSVSKDYLSCLRQVGFNRISFGIQEVNQWILRSVNRPQDLIHLNKILEHAQRLNFLSINYDFIYGLPYQSVDNFIHNIQWIRKFRPSRISNRPSSSGL